VERFVVFLDLLGFATFMSHDKEGAIRLLWNYETILATKKIEDNLHPVTSYEQSLQSLAEKRSINSFEYFLPFSDSLIVTSTAEEADVFLKQIGSFILDSFLFTARAYKAGGEATTVDMTHLVDEGNGSFRKIIVKEQWFPVLFRGGMTYGDAEVLEKTALYSGKAGSSYCVAGGAMIDAVILEKKYEGPGLVFNEFVYKKIRDKDFIARYVGTHDHAYELFWPGLYFIDGNNATTEKLKFAELFIPAVNLWKLYSHLECSPKYFYFIKLVIRSTFAFFKERLKEAEIEEMVRHYIVKEGIQAKVNELLDRS